MYDVIVLIPVLTSISAHLLSYLLETVQHRDTRDTVDLAERVETDGVQVMFAGYLSILDDGSGRVVNYHHGMVTLEKCG